MWLWSLDQTVFRKQKTLTISIATVASERNDNFHITKQINCTIYWQCPYKVISNDIVRVFGLSFNIKNNTANHIWVFLPTLDAAHTIDGCFAYLLWKGSNHHKKPKKVHKALVCTYNVTHTTKKRKKKAISKGRPYKVKICKSSRTLSTEAASSHTYVHTIKLNASMACIHVCKQKERGHLKCIHVYTLHYLLQCNESLHLETPREWIRHVHAWYAMKIQYWRQLG